METYDIHIYLYANAHNFFFITAQNWQESRKKRTRTHKIQIVASKLFCVLLFAVLNCTTVLNKSDLVQTHQRYRAKALHTMKMTVSFHTAQTEKMREEERGRERKKTPHT